MSAADIKLEIRDLYITGAKQVRWPRGCERLLLDKNGSLKARRGEVSVAASPSMLCNALVFDHTCGCHGARP